MAAAKTVKDLIKLLSAQDQDKEVVFGLGTSDYLTSFNNFKFEKAVHKDTKKEILVLDIENCDSPYAYIGKGVVKDSF